MAKLTGPKSEFRGKPYLTAIRLTPIGYAALKAQCTRQDVSEAVVIERLLRQSVGIDDAQTHELS